MPTGGITEDTGLEHLTIAGNALHKSKQILDEFILDSKKGETVDDWRFVHGGVIACIDIAHDGMNKYTSIQAKQRSTG